MALRVDGLKDLKVVDAGDLLMPSDDLAKCLALLRAATEKISRAVQLLLYLGETTQLHRQMWPVLPTIAASVKFQ
jgi:hypothetical protein